MSSSVDRGTDRSSTSSSSLGRGAGGAGGATGSAATASATVHPQQQGAASTSGATAAPGDQRTTAATTAAAATDGPGSSSGGSNSSAKSAGHHHHHHQRKLIPRTDFLRRPGWCSSGEPIKLVTNHYGIRIQCPRVFMYDVTITPMFYDKRKNEYRPINGPQERRMNKQASENNRQVISKFYESMTTPGDIFYDKETNKVIGYAYDGVKTLFTATLLRHEHEDKIYRRERVEIEINERTKCYEVVMKYTSEVDMSALQAHRQGAHTPTQLITHNLLIRFLRFPLLRHHHLV